MQSFFFFFFFFFFFSKAKTSFVKGKLNPTP